MGDLTENFSRDEFKCPCCGLDTIDLEFVYLLQLIRDIAGIPFGITEGGGCRCENYGTYQQSAHKIFKASDIACTSSADRFKIIKAALIAPTDRIDVSLVNAAIRSDTIAPAATLEKLRNRPTLITRIGIGKGFVHLDSVIDDTKTQDIIWHYYD